MAATATLIAVPVKETKNHLMSTNNRDSTTHKKQEQFISSKTHQTIQSLSSSLQEPTVVSVSGTKINTSGTGGIGVISNVSTFRIPKIKK
jgi:hypothetical protein